MKDILTLFQEVRQKYSVQQIAEIINVNLNTVRRWETLNSVPQSYYIELLKMNGEPIDYSLFSAKEKDQFFTSEENVTTCLTHLQTTLLDYDINVEDYVFVEPAAGAGAFVKKLPSNTIAMDIEPMSSNIMPADFLLWRPSVARPYITIGNPPFGLRGQLALKFINHAAEFSDFIGFILPPLFDSDGKGTPKLRVKNAKLLSTIPIGSNYFYPNNTPVKINTIFQIWTTLPLTGLDTIKYTPNGYKIYSLSDGGTPSTTRNKNMLDNCDYFLPSTVFGANKIKLYESFEDLPQRRGYGIKIFDDVEQNNVIIQNLDWSKKAFVSTNGAYNLRTSIIVEAIESSKIKEL